MSIKIREVKNITILDIEGTININSAEIIETVGWLVNTGKLYIILNFENVDLVDYSGLSVLAIAYKNVVNHKGKLKFLHTPLHIIEMFKVVRLDLVFETYSDEEAAVKSFEEEEIEKLPLRRKFKRLDIHLTVKYRIANAGKKVKYFEGGVLNFSAAGFYVYSPHTFPINTLLDLELALPDTPIPLEASGMVIWLADKEIQPHSYPGMGVAFLHLSQEKERMIVEFIDKNITHRAEP